MGPRQPGGARLRVWLAFDVSGYQLWDGWILVALALGRSGAFGSQLSQGYKAMTNGTVARTGPSAHVVATAAVRLAHRHGLEARRMTYLLIRPDSWNLPLFVHVAGAMVVTAAVVVTVAALALAWRATGEERAAITRFGFRTLLYRGDPRRTWSCGRGGVDRSRENIPSKHEPGWVGIGYGTADLGGILILSQRY